LVSKKFIIMMTLLTIICISKNSIYAQAPYKSYTYNMSGGNINVVYSPLPYLPVRVIDSKTIGVQMKRPEDFHKDSFGNIYVIDSETNKLLCLDDDWNLISEITGYFSDGIFLEFNKPQGVFVSTEDIIYIADTGNKQIVVLDNKGDFIYKISELNSPIFKDNFVFEPLKLAIGESGSIYVLAKGVYEGIMEITQNGDFIGYIGSNPVQYDPIELLWKNIMTTEQKDRMVQFTPIEYTNIHIDKTGFIYAVTSSENIDTPVRRLNPSGRDILIRNPIIPVNPIHGDSRTIDIDTTIKGPSVFVDICTHNNGIYSVLDSKRGRIFTYDNQSNLLHVFGGIGTNQLGTFRRPVAIEVKGEDILVLDSGLASITIFEPTKYSTLISEGINLYNMGLYDESLEIWENVVILNTNFDYAYSKMGNAYLRQNRYEESMESFKLSYDKKGYAKAYKKYREGFLQDNLAYFLSLMLISVLFYSVSKKYINKKRRNRKHGKYS